MTRALAVLLLAFAPAFSFAQTIDRISVYGTAGKSMTGEQGQADLQSINFEVGKALTSHYDIAFVVAPMNVQQPRSWFGNQLGANETVRAISGSLLLRRSFNLDSPRTNTYVELSSGPMWAERRVPAATSRFNFISQAGAGFVLRPQSRFPMIVGLRFAHLSNGGYSPRNPGLNVTSLVIGTRIRSATSR